MKQAPLIIPFILASFFTIFASALFPGIKLLAFSPFLALTFNRCSFQKTLWISSLSGFIVDLLSADLKLGLHALNYCLVTLILYQQKRHFFEDKPLAVCLFTGLISLVSTLLQWLLLTLFGKSFTLSKGLLLTDLAVLPLVDAAYAFICFCSPLMLYSHIKKRGWKAFCETLLRFTPFKKLSSEENS